MSPDQRTPGPDWLLILVWACVMMIGAGLWTAVVLAIIQVAR